MSREYREKDGSKSMLNETSRERNEQWERVGGSYLWRQVNKTVIDLG